MWDTAQGGDGRTWTVVDTGWNNPPWSGRFDPWEVPPSYLTRVDQNGIVENWQRPSGPVVLEPMAKETPRARSRCSSPASRDAGPNVRAAPQWFYLSWNPFRLGSWSIDVTIYDGNG